MTALYIILGIIFGLALIIYILLRISVRAYVSVSNNGLSVLVKYLWFKLYKLDKSFTKDINANDADVSFVELSQEDDDSTDAKNESDDEPSADEISDDELMGKSEDGEDKKKKGVKEILDEYMPYLPVAKKALRKLLKLIRFYDLDINIKVGDNDAYEAAMKFGKYNALFYSFLALLCTAFSVKIKNTNITCDFENSGLSASCNTTVKVRPSAVLSLLIYLGINYLKIKHNQKRKEKKLNKEKEI